MRVLLVPGLLAGIVLGLAFMLLNSAGRELSYGARETLGLLAMLVAVATAQVYALRHHPLGRDVSFPARYFTAMLAAAAAAVVYGLLAWIYFGLLDPGYLENFHAEYMERAREAARANGGEEQLRTAEEMKAFIIDPFSQAMVQFGTTLMIGLLAAIGTAALVRPAKA